MSTALTQGIRFFTRETGILSALAAACGTESRTETATDGGCASTSVFDLASVTKLFTGLCLMKLKEDGLLDFSRPVSFYDPRFENLKDTPVDALAKFALTLKTPCRLDACGSREEALEAHKSAVMEAMNRHAAAENHQTRLKTMLSTMDARLSELTLSCEQMKREALEKEAKDRG